MIKITNKIIESFNPCKDGIDDFNKKYPNYNNSLFNLLQLENISYDHKIWLIRKTVDIKTLKQWSVECAETVVDNYNKEYPNDNQINECIEMSKRYILGECSLVELTDAWSAAWSVWSTEYTKSAAKYVKSAFRSAESAKSAARSIESAARSAESACYAARSAAWSACYAESASWDACYAVRAAVRSAGKEENQEDLNLSILIALLENQ